MKKSELASRILASVKDMEKAHVSDFNREVLRELAEAEFTGEADDAAVKKAESLLESFLNEVWAEEPLAHKYVIGSCLALAFLFERPMHPQKAVHYISRIENGRVKYYCTYNERGTICDFCAAAPADELAEDQNERSGEQN